MSTATKVVTVSDVAGDVGCHYSTVYAAISANRRGLTRSPRVSESMMRRVMEATARLGYHARPDVGRAWGLHLLSEVCAATGATERMLDYWSTQGVVPFTMVAHDRRYDRAAVALVALLVRMIDEGCLGFEAARVMVAGLDAGRLPAVLVLTHTGFAREADDMVHAVSTVAPLVREVSGEHLVTIIDVAVVTGPALEKLEGATNGDN